MNSTTTGQSGQMQAAAIRYAKRGWHVFPVHQSIGGVCSCDKKDECDPKSQGKHPATRYGFKDATNEESKILRLCRDRRNLGIRTGSTSGLFIIDIDPRNGGIETLTRLKAILGSLSKTLTAKTSGGGCHLYFEYTPELERFKKPDDWAGIDLKGNGGYVVAPPSLHPAGETYAWEDYDVTLARLPKRWLDAISRADTVLESAERVEKAEVRRGSQKKVEAISPSKASLVSEKDFQRILAATLPLAKGNRHKAVFQFAREIKSLPGCENTKVKDYRELVIRWHKEGQNAGVIGTEDPEISLSDFYIGWPRVKFLMGEGPLAEVMIAARTNPQPEVANRYESKAVRLLICLCRELQRVSSGKFFLSCYTAGIFAELEPRQALRYLKMLEKEEVIEVVEPGTQGTRGKATRYRYLGD